jgi:hypothetical protein
LSQAMVRSTTQRRGRSNQDMLVIDKMLEIFGPNGEHWIKGFDTTPAGAGAS